MVAHILFPVLLYLLGVLLFVPAGDAIPRRFVAWTAFAWGALAWMIAALLVLVLPVPYTPAAVSVALVLLAGAVFLALRHRVRRTSVPPIMAFVWPFGLFAIVVTIPSLLQVAEMHPDTYDMLLMASDLASGELSATTLNNLGLFGLGLPLLQSAAPWFGVAFFYSVPAAFTFTIIAALRYFCYQGLLRLDRSTPDAARIANLATLLFASTMWVVFQFAYIHNGSIAATFLLLGAGGGWLAMVDGKKSWLWLASFAFLGMSLARVETVFFAIAFFVVMLSLDRFSIGLWPRLLMPFTALLLAWYGWLLLVARPETKFLTPPRILVFAGVVAIFFAGVSSLQLAPLRRIPKSHLYRWLLAALGLIAAVMIVVSPAERFFDPMWSTIVTFFLLGVTWWGLIWWFAVVALLLVARAPHFQYQRALAGVITAFFALYVVFGLLHGYAAAFDGSGNRMALHILPVIFLYLTLRAAPYLAPAAVESIPGRRSGTI
jgi:hypothetical protein